MDPMALAMLLQGVNNMARNMAGNADPRMTAASDSQMIPQMIAMQRMQGDVADRQFRQQQFQVAQEAAAAREQAAREFAARHPEIDPALAMTNMDAFAQAAAENTKGFSLGPGEHRFVGGKDVASVAPNLVPIGGVGWLNPGTGEIFTDKNLAALKMAAARASAPRTSVQILQDAQAAELAKASAGSYAEIDKAAQQAQAGLAAYETVYAIAKENSDLFGPGMELKSEAIKKIEELNGLVSKGKSISPDDQRLLDIAFLVDTARSKSAVAQLRNIGGNDTEKEYDRMKGLIPGLDQSISTHEATIIQERTAANHLLGMNRFVGENLDASIRDKTNGVATVSRLRDQYNREHPLGEELAANLKAVMASRPAPAASAPPPPSAGAPSPNAAQYFVAPPAAGQGQPLMMGP